jgi:UDP-N-acetylmuramate dehydrogenase
MTIRENVNLADYSTMRLGGRAHYLAEAASMEEVQKLVRWARQQNLATRMIGRGSNIVWRDEGFAGLVIVNKIMGKKILNEDDQSAVVELFGGENWDQSVEWTIQKGLSGLEFLSLIPGTVGAAPVQNVGAYGGELSSVTVAVGVYDSLHNRFESIPAIDCGFTYRNSRFKSSDAGRFMITNIVLRLKKANPEPPFYESLQKYFDQHNITKFTPEIVREAVIAIRSAKLPDPEAVSNNGSFFTNPIIKEAQFQQLLKKYPDIKGWSAGEDNVKVAAGWLVDKAGFKGVHDQETGMATWPMQALVLVNEHAKSTADLLKFKQKIVDKVQELFGIKLEQEPELLP